MVSLDLAPLLSPLKHQAREPPPPVLGSSGLESWLHSQAFQTGIGGEREGVGSPERASFKDASFFFFLLNGPFIQWPQDTWRPPGRAFLSITAFLFECIIHFLGCSKEPKEVPHSRPVPNGSLALCVPSLCPPCFPFQGALRPGQGLPVSHTWEHCSSSVSGGMCVHLCSPLPFSHVCSPAQ